jgi:hypothetical protein
MPSLIVSSLLAPFADDLTLSVEPISDDAGGDTADKLAAAVSATAATACAQAAIEADAAASDAAAAVVTAAEARVKSARAATKLQALQRGKARKVSLMVKKDVALKVQALFRRSKGGEGGSKLPRSPVMVATDVTLAIMIEIHSATGLANTAIFGTQNPYCIAKVGVGTLSPPQRTQAVVGGGMAPQWDGSEVNGSMCIKVETTVQVPSNLSTTNLSTTNLSTNQPEPSSITAAEVRAALSRMFVRATRSLL